MRILAVIVGLIAVMLSHVAAYPGFFPGPFPRFPPQFGGFNPNSLRPPQSSGGGSGNKNNPGPVLFPGTS